MHESVEQARALYYAQRRKESLLDEMRVAAQEARWHNPQTRAIRDRSAHAIAAARERSDRQAEAAALVGLSEDLLDSGWHGEAGEAAGRALQLARRERSRHGLKVAERALAAARDLDDDIAEVLALLDRGRFLAARGQHAEAEAAFAQAVRLARTATTAQRSGDEYVRQRSLSSMTKALREAGLDETALESPSGDGHVDDKSAPVDRQPTSVTVANRADHVYAQNIVQVGVVHDGVHIITDPVGRFDTALNVSVATSQMGTTWQYEGHHADPDTKVCIFVEAFTAQAVLLRGLRPVFVREIPWSSVSNLRHDAVEMPPREFLVGWDGRAHHQESTRYYDPTCPGHVDDSANSDDAAHRYDADISGQVLCLDRAYAEGGADFPFYLTASAPEYFVIWPGMRGTLGLVEWRLELDWSCLRQHGTVTIDHDGRPFLSDGSQTSLLDWPNERRS